MSNNNLDQVRYFLGENRVTLNAEQISRMTWSTFKGNIEPNIMPFKNIVDEIVIAGDETYKGIVLFYFKKEDISQFAKLMITKNMEQNVIEVYDEIDFDDDGNPTYGKKMYSLTFDYNDITKTWNKVFSDKKGEETNEER